MSQLYMLILMRLKCFVNEKIKDFQVKKNGFTQHIKKVKKNHLITLNMEKLTNI